MARCPNCAGRVAWDAAVCANCDAAFDGAAAWRIEPESWEERQNLDRRYAALAPSSAPSRAFKPAYLGAALIVAAMFLAPLVASRYGAPGAFAALVLVGAALVIGGLVVVLVASGRRLAGAALVLMGVGFAVIGGGGYRVSSDRVEQEQPSLLFSSTLERGTKRTGSAYMRIEMSAWDERLCTNYCANDAGCMAWTLYLGQSRRRGEVPYCRLMTSVGDAAKDECCTSGVKIRKVSQ